MLLIFLTFIILLKTLVIGHYIPPNLAIFQPLLSHNVTLSTAATPTTITTTTSRPLLSDWPPTPYNYPYDPHPYSLTIYTYGRTASRSIAYLITHNLDLLIFRMIKSSVQAFSAPISESEGIVSLTALFLTPVNTFQLARALQVVRDLMTRYGPRELRAAGIGKGEGAEWKEMARIQLDFEKV